MLHFGTLIAPLPRNSARGQIFQPVLEGTGKLIGEVECNQRKVERFEFREPRGRTNRATCRWWADCPLQVAMIERKLIFARCVLTTAVLLIPDQPNSARAGIPAMQNFRQSALVSSRGIGSIKKKRHGVLSPYRWHTKN